MAVVILATQGWVVIGGKSGKTGKCPHCGQEKPSRHPMMCSKNPNRTVGTKITKAGSTVQSDPAIQSSSPPQIVAKVEPVPEASLPNFSTPESSQGPPPGAVAGAQETPLNNVIPSAQVVRPLIDVCLDAFEKRLQTVEGRAPVQSRPEPFSEQDKNALATVYGACLDKYLPAAWLQKYGLEVSAVLLTVTIVVPKIFEYRAYYKQLHSKKKVEKQSDEAGLGAGYQLQNGGGDPDAALKAAYARALEEGRAPR